MWHLVVKFTWILVVTVNTGRRFSRLVHLRCHIAHSIVQWLRPPLILRSSITYFVILSIVLGNDHALAHPALERRSIILSSNGPVLPANDWTFIKLFEISPINTACTCLWIIVVCHRSDNRWWSSIDRVASTVCHVDWWRVVADAARHRAAIVLLQVVRHFYLLVTLSRLIEISLLISNVFFVSLGGLWLKRSEGIGGKATDCFDVILNLWSDLIVSDEGTADRSLRVSFFVLTLALSLVALSQLILSWVVVLHVLNVLVLVHCERRDSIHSCLVALNVRSWVSCGFWCAVCAARVTWPRLPVRPNELDGSSTSLIYEVFHERVASLLTAALSHTILMLCLRVHLTLSLFPAIFQIFRSRTISKNLGVLNGTWKLSFGMMVVMEWLTSGWSTHVVRVTIHFVKESL